MHCLKLGRPCAGPSLFRLAPSAFEDGSNLRAADPELALQRGGVHPGLDRGADQTDLSRSQLRPIRPRWFGVCRSSLASLSDNWCSLARRSHFAPPGFEGNRLCQSLQFVLGQVGQRPVKIMWQQVRLGACVRSPAVILRVLPLFHAPKYRMRARVPQSPRTAAEAGSRAPTRRR